jgi:hypothetical protein
VLFPDIWTLPHLQRTCSLSVCCAFVLSSDCVTLTYTSRPTSLLASNEASDPMTTGHYKRKILSADHSKSKKVLTESKLLKWDFMSSLHFFLPHNTTQTHSCAVFLSVFSVPALTVNSERTAPTVYLFISQFWFLASFKKHKLIVNNYKWNQCLLLKQKSLCRS